MAKSIKPMRTEDDSVCVRSNCTIQRADWKRYFMFITGALVWVGLTGEAATVHYVDVNSSSPVSPYTSWAAAATSIQDAVDASTAGDEVLVTNGVYAAGGRAVYGTMTNRVAVTQALFVHSVNGLDYSFIEGSQVPGTTNGDGAIRCVYLTNGASLAGFTLRNGATRIKGDQINEGSGGAIWCESEAAVVSNCLVKGNSSDQLGGGVYSGTLWNCTFLQNFSDDGGGAAYSTMSNCTISANSTAAYGGGGGVFEATLDNCTLSGNSANTGGGAVQSILRNCMLIGNSALNGSGGGAYGSDLFDCTVVSNSAFYAGGVYVFVGAQVFNCIVYFNAAQDTNHSNYSGFAPGFNYTCTAPMPPSGSGNITNDPQFVDLASGNLHLQPTSPCVDSGNSAYAMGVDLDFNPRISGSNVDMGAYEFQNSSSADFRSWLASYGLATDGSADYTDPDGDGMNNWREWRCQTNPTNALSVLKMISAQRTNNDVVISWQSVAGVKYFIHRGTNLVAGPSFGTVTTNVPGQAGVTSYLDVNAAGAKALFYRVGVGN
jgi:hypothetical protein